MDWWWSRPDKYLPSWDRTNACKCQCESGCYLFIGCQYLWTLILFSFLLPVPHFQCNQYQPRSTLLGMCCALHWAAGLFDINSFEYMMLACCYLTLPFLHINADETRGASGKLQVLKIPALLLYSFWCVQIPSLGSCLPDTESSPIPVNFRVRIESLSKRLDLQTRPVH